MVTCALWDIESAELDRRPRRPKTRVAFNLIIGTVYPTYTRDHCLSILMLCTEILNTHLENGCTHSTNPHRVFQRSIFHNVLIHQH